MLCLERNAKLQAKPKPKEHGSYAVCDKTQYVINHKSDIPTHFTRIAVFSLCKGPNTRDQSTKMARLQGSVSLEGNVSLNNLWCNKIKLILC